MPDETTQPVVKRNRGGRPKGSKNKPKTRFGSEMGDLDKLKRKERPAWAGEISFEKDTYEVKFGTMRLPWPTPEEAVAALVAQGQFTGVIERMVMDVFRIEDRVELNEVMRKGREMVEARALKSRAQHAVDSLNFYIYMASNMSLPDYTRLQARERVDRLLGLEAMARQAMEGIEVAGKEVVDVSTLTTGELLDIEASLSSTMKKALERTRSRKQITIPA